LPAETKSGKTSARSGRTRVKCSALQAVVQCFALPQATLPLACGYENQALRAKMLKCLLKNRTLAKKIMPPVLSGKAFRTGTGLITMTR